MSSPLRAFAIEFPIGRQDVSDAMTGRLEFYDHAGTGAYPSPLSVLPSPVLKVPRISQSFPADLASTDEKLMEITVLNFPITTISTVGYSLKALIAEGLWQVNFKTRVGVTTSLRFTGFVDETALDGEWGSFETARDRDRRYTITCKGNHPTYFLPAWVYSWSNFGFASLFDLRFTLNLGMITKYAGGIVVSDGAHNGMDLVRVDSPGDGVIVVDAKFYKLTDIIGIGLDDGTPLYPLNSYAVSAIECDHVFKGWGTSGAVSYDLDEIYLLSSLNEAWYYHQRETYGFFANSNKDADDISIRKLGGKPEMWRLLLQSLGLRASFVVNEAGFVTGTKIEPMVKEAVGIAGIPSLILEGVDLEDAETTTTGFRCTVSNHGEKQFGADSDEMNLDIPYIGGAAIWDDIQIYYDQYYPVCTNVVPLYHSLYGSKDGSTFVAITHVDVKRPGIATLEAIPAGSTRDERGHLWSRVANSIYSIVFNAGARPAYSMDIAALLDIPQGQLIDAYLGDGKYYLAETVETDFGTGKTSLKLARADAP